MAAHAALHHDALRAQRSWHLVVLTVAGLLPAFVLAGLGVDSVPVLALTLALGPTIAAEIADRIDPDPRPARVARGWLAVIKRVCGRVWQTPDQVQSMAASALGRAYAARASGLTWAETANQLAADLSSVAAASVRWQFVVRHTPAGFMLFVFGSIGLFWTALAAAPISFSFGG